MSHYAKLAALGFRWLGVAILFYTLPSLVMAFIGFRAMSIGPDMPLMALVALFHPILALLLILAARPLGKFAARGIE